VAGGLSAGASTTVTSPAWQAIQGSHAVLVRADPDNRLPESNENNNDLATSIRVGVQDSSSGSVRVTALRLSPASPDPGALAQAVATLEAPDAPRGGTIVVSFSLDGNVVGGPLEASWNGGPTMDVTSGGWVAANGTHTITAGAALPGQAVSQDSFHSLTFTVGASGTTTATGTGGASVADLAVLAVGPDNAGAQPGDTVALVARVANQGTLDAPPFAVAFYADGVRIGTAGAPALPAGATANVTLPGWVVLAGSHNLRAEADPTNAVTELRKDNNVLDAAFNPSSAPPAAKPIKVPGPDALLACGALAVALGLARRKR
jgi:hypothetical protein